MVQVAAALLFALAAGLGITVILAMLKGNGDAILSALIGDGAFPIETAPKPGPTLAVVSVSRAAPRRGAPQPVRVARRAQPLVSRAA